MSGSATFETDLLLVAFMLESSCLVSFEFPTKECFELVVGDVIARHEGVVDEETLSILEKKSSYIS